MLTREQIDHAWEILNELFKQILYAVNIAPYKNIHDQAKQAIDLAAENATLKAKLDTVRKAATEETYGTANMSWSKAMQKILEIIDKESDNDA